jgi:hypothetical protein
LEGGFQAFIALIRPQKSANQIDKFADN